MIGIYLCSWLALQLASTILIYFVQYYMRVPGQIPLILLAVQGTSFIFLFVWDLIGRKFNLEKKTIFIAGAAHLACSTTPLVDSRANNTEWVIPLAAMAGVGVAVVYLIPWSMTPDVIEFDEWETGRRREGIFYGFIALNAGAENEQDEADDQREADDPELAQRLEVERVGVAHEAADRALAGPPELEGAGARSRPAARSRSRRRRPPVLVAAVAAGALEALRCPRSPRRLP